MALRLEVTTGQGLATAATGRGFARDFFIGGQQGAVVGLVSGLGASATPGGFTRRRTLDVGCVTGRGPGGVLRVLSETGVEIGNLLTQIDKFSLKVAEDAKEGGLGGWRNQIPKFLGDREVLRHTLIIG